ncbi:L-glutamate gamma-semialdehyde dehydrogenase [bacterium]|nr:L-glutamate gamma-semialdehyde dehydrogenase [bacterium]
MPNSMPFIPDPINEPITPYAPGTPERAALQAKLKQIANKKVEVPLIIGGKRVRTGKTANLVCPHEHEHVLGKYHKGDAKTVERAIAAAKKAWPEWALMPWEHRMAIFLKAAELLAGPYRDTLNAVTMLNQSKNAFQAEIDSACELIDFWRFNPWYAQQVYEQQPPMQPTGIWNYVEQRPLEGFVFAVTPFNFTSIAGNLPTAPAMMGNTVVWKPASSAVYNAYIIMEILNKAGLPDGVINMVPGSGGSIGNPVMASPDLAGVHFTGSTAVFQNMWKVVGENIAKYQSYPRIVGETGGKDFVFVHASAEADAVATALVRGAFEYQGQKCSAASRAYLPKSLWPKVSKKLYSMLETITIGDVQDFTNFMNAVIDQNAYNDITGYIKYAKRHANAKVEFGGGFSDKVGYFIEPTVIVAKDPHFKTMEEEIFGPVLTIYVYNDKDYEKTLRIANETSPYALTGAIFATDRQAVVQAYAVLTHAAGNFYINDKPTGAVVGQQPFGGSRASGTNDKAGSMINLLRWVSPRTVKETFCPPTDYRYPFLGRD